MYRQRNSLGGLTGGIFLIGLALAFFIGGGHFFLSILFATLAFCSLFGSLATLNPRGFYGGLQGFVWLLGLGILWAASLANQQPQPAYQPPPTYEPYQQGYQPQAPAQSPETYQEGGQQNPYQPQPQYEQPQVQYPQELPPQQQSLSSGMHVPRVFLKGGTFYALPLPQSRPQAL